MSKVLMHNYGTYHFLGQSYKMSATVPYTEFGYEPLYFNEPIVRSWFHNLLTKLYKEEDKYFHETDETEVLKSDVRKLISKFDSISPLDIDVNYMSNDELMNIKDILIKMYEQDKDILESLNSMYKKEGV